VDPVTASIVISKPQEELFAYLADVRHLPEFLDHFTRGWHLTREDTYGPGAGVRFAFKQRRNKYPWVDATIVEFHPPRQIVLAGRAGKFNRVRSVLVFDLEPSSGGATRLNLSYETVPKMLSDRLVEKPRFHKSRWNKALRRLRDIMEEDRGRGASATIAGGPRKPASGYRFVASDHGLGK
jgi:uncharacterized protein YndB with AHSA1/START domain